MANVKFKGYQEIFQINIRNIERNMVQLYPPIPSINITAGFELLTNPKDGKVFGNYLAYTTLYRKLEDGSIILSNDGSTYIPPTPPEPPVYKVTFVTDGNGELVGENEQTPKTPSPSLA